MKKKTLLILFATAALTVNALTQTGTANKPVVIAVSEKILGLDTLSNSSTSAATDRVRELIYNSLVKRDEAFEYVGDYKIGNDNLTVTFRLKDNIKFHNGKILSSADVKYTFDAGAKYAYDPAKARRLLKEAGYRGKAVKFIYAPGNQTTSRYVKVVQSMLKDAGFNVEIEAFEPQTLIAYLKDGRFQMSTSSWIGANQDPVFYQDLFASENSPEKIPYGRNRALLESGIR